jgi:hypothetical protein
MANFMAWALSRLHPLDIRLVEPPELTCTKYREEKYLSNARN